MSTLPEFLRCPPRASGAGGSAIRLLLAVGTLSLVLPGRAEDKAAQPAEAPSTVDSAPKPLKVVSPEHPAGLLEKGVSGEAEVECLVSERGEVTEAKITAASRPEFGEAALAAIKQWVFLPATRDGRAIATRVAIPFNFAVPDDSSLDAYLKRKVFQEITEPVISAEDIGSWPMPKMVVEPNYPKALVGSGKRGKAVVSIVIGKDGKVINPKLVKATFPEFEFPALAAAASMEFAPQLNAKREKIYVSMDVQFDFHESGRPKAPKPPPVAPRAGKDSAQPSAPDPL